MARLGHGRTTPLTGGEIAAELVRQYDTATSEPSIRSLAAALGVTPRAIYHYYRSRRELIEAAIELVWEEAAADVVVAFAEPEAALDDPVELFVVIGVATRRAFGRHHRLARYLGMTSEPNERLAGAVALLGAAFERLGLEGDDAGQALHSYLTFVLGSIVLAANRWIVESDATTAKSAAAPFSTSGLRPEGAPDADDGTLRSIDEVLGGDRTDDAAIEALFEVGLRRLIRSFAADTAT